MKQTLKLVGMPVNLNVYRNMHYHVLNNLKSEWELIVKTCVIGQKLKPVNRIIMTYEFFFKNNQRHDPDNYACCAKFINDGLVNAGILPDDDFKHIKSLRIEEGEERVKSPFILVHMEEV